MNQNFHIISKTILILVLIQNICSHSTIIDDNYVPLIDNNVPNPLQALLPSQVYQSDQSTTVPIIIETPQILHPVYNIEIQNNTGNNCWVQKKQTVKIYGDYIKFQKSQLGNFQGWPVQILDGTYSLLQQKVYAILTNGSLLISSIRSTIQGANQVFGFQIYDYQSSQQSQIWQLDQYELHYGQSNVYLIRDKQLYKIQFLPNKKWSMTALKNGDNVNQLVRSQNHLYLIKAASIHRIQNGQVSQSLTNFVTYIDSSVQLIDASIDNEMMYVLCRLHGLFVVDINQNYKIINNYVIDFHDAAYKVSAKNRTILVNYKLYRRTFVGEYLLTLPYQLFFSPLHSTKQAHLKLNKIYYRFQEMDKVVLFQDFALIYSLSQMSLFQHSINRNFPFGQKQTQRIYMSYFPKILDVIPLDSKNLRYILIQKNGIFVQQLGKEGYKGLMDKQLKCVFSKMASYQILIKYEGFYNGTTDRIYGYCSKIDTHIFNVNSQKVIRLMQTYNNHAFLILILIMILVLVVGAILAYRRYIKDRKQKLLALLARRAGSNNDMISMNGVSEINAQNIKNKK